jgi:uncharacterized protein
MTEASEASIGGKQVNRAAFALPPDARRIVSTLGGLGVLLGLAVLGVQINTTEGARASLSLLLGVALGITFQRGRFCFFCILRDFIEHHNSSGLFAIVTALAVGGIGYALVFGATLPNPMRGTLPPNAHIGPLSWVTVVAGVVFGVGMALSGACISGHLYRLGEGYSRAPFALFGSLIGFGLGFFTWQSVYLDAIRAAPVAWLPATFGYGGSLIIHLTILGIAALFLLRFVPERSPQPGGRLTLAQVRDTVLQQRWNPLVTGTIVGLIGVVAYYRLVQPLGVTSQIGTLSRTALDGAGLLSGRLNGLDDFAGCATRVVQTITDNGWLIGGLAAGSFTVVLLANKFQLSRLSVRSGFTALLGGVLMGWSAMLALGCTVGTLLSGISAFAVTGWVFGAAVFAGVWLGLRLNLVER